VSDRKAEMESLEAAKKNGENLFSQSLTELQQKLSEVQQKLNASEALLHEKDVEIQEATTRGMKHYVNSWESVQKSLRDKVTAAEGEKHELEEKLTSLAAAETQRGEELAKLSRDGKKMRELLEKQKRRLTFALEKENTEMLRGDKLEAENRDLQIALDSEKKLEPQLEELRQQAETLTASNGKLMASEKAARKELEQTKKAQEQATRSAKEVRSKFDFAVDQENTQMIAVKILQNENAELKEALRNATKMQVVLHRDEADLQRKESNIRLLDTENEKANVSISELHRQIDDLTRKNQLLQEQYEAEHSKSVSVADQLSTESLAVKVLQGQKQRLEHQLQQAADEEAEMAMTVKTTQAKATASEMFEEQSDQIRSDLSTTKHREDMLRRKNEELQETIVAMAARVREAEVAEKLQVAQKHTTSEDLDRPTAKEDSSQPNELEKASSDLSVLVAQLRRNNEDNGEKKT